MALAAPVEANSEEELDKRVDDLRQPLYSPFVERYVLDELKQLRLDHEKTRQEMLQKIVDREYQAIDRAISYSTNTVTYFFYFIAAATSMLVLVGWTSIKDIKERVGLLADEEIAKLVSQYEARLASIEEQLQQKTLHIEENREEIELTQEVQSLWLRAQQESSPANKIEIYDAILKLRFYDTEALTYKADAVLELGEPQWAVNLCLQVLKKDQENSHAFYQLACAYTVMNQFDEAIHYLGKALSLRDSYREDMLKDSALKPLQQHAGFEKLLHSYDG